MYTQDQPRRNDCPRLCVAKNFLYNRCRTGDEWILAVGRGKGMVFLPERKATPGYDIGRRVVVVFTRRHTDLAVLCSARADFTNGAEVCGKPAADFVVLCFSVLLRTHRTVYIPRFAVRIGIAIQAIRTRWPSMLPKLEHMPTQRGCMGHTLLCTFLLRPSILVKVALLSQRKDPTKKNAPVRR